MNQEAERLLERSGAALNVPAVVSFIQALQILAPENISGLAKKLRDVAGEGQVWEKSIVDLARLTKQYPREFSEAIKEIAMKRTKQVVLTPRLIQKGLNAPFKIEDLDCILQLKAFGSGSDDACNLMNKPIETEGYNSGGTFNPYFGVKLFLPPVSKDELFGFIDCLSLIDDCRGDARIEVDGHELTVDAHFGKTGKDYQNFQHLLFHKEDRKTSKRGLWENDLDEFPLGIWFHIFEEDIKGSKIPSYFKSRDFRMKIVLLCLRKYFGFEVEI